MIITQSTLQLGLALKIALATTYYGASQIVSNSVNC